jgi:CheY-like chemotaxis protein
LTVEDTGIGIPAEELEHIFEEFTQLQNPERDRSKGLGLGLSIVRRLTQLLDHPLEVHSVPGQGTRFDLMVPLREPRPRETSADRAGATPAVELDLTVLVVDDDSEVLIGTRTLLESWGCTVLCAADASEALAMARRHTGIDALVTDFRLPGDARGTALVQEVRDALGRAVPALLVTGDTEPARLQEAEEYGLTLLHKPANPARFRAWLQRLPSG